MTIRRWIVVVSLTALVVAVPAGACGTNGSDAVDVNTAPGEGSSSSVPVSSSTTVGAGSSSVPVTSTVGSEPAGVVSDLPPYLEEVVGIESELERLRQPLFVPVEEPELASPVAPIFVVTSYRNYRLKWSDEVVPGRSVSVVGRDAEVDPAWGEFVFEDPGSGIEFLVDGDPSECASVEDIGALGGVWQWEVEHSTGRAKLGVEVRPPPGCEDSPLTVEEILALIDSIEIAYDPGVVEERVVSVHEPRLVAAGVTVEVADLSERVPGTAVTLALSGLEPGVEVGAAACPTDVEVSERACGRQSSVRVPDETGRADVAVLAPSVLRTDLTIVEAGTGERESADIDCRVAEACELVVADRNGTVLAVVPFTA